MFKVSTLLRYKISFLI